MSTRVLVHVLAAGLAVIAAVPRHKRPHSPKYVPDPKLWRLDLKPDLGGWSSQARLELQLKVVDPRDPKPPQDTGPVDPYADGEAWVEDQEQGQERDWPAEQRWNEEEQKRNAWRNRKVQYWFNGTPCVLDVRVGHTATLELTCLNGENRLEVVQPDSGRRLVRTWWAISERVRLQVTKLSTERSLWGDQEGFWGGGGLEILEPDGQLVSPGRKSRSGGTLTYGGTYLNPTPPPGTYTLRWTSGERGEKPYRVCVEVVLDGGTEQERRWRFEKLVLPGTGPVTLGTVDVES